MSDLDRGEWYWLPNTGWVSSAVYEDFEQALLESNKQIREALRDLMAEHEGRARRRNEC